MPTHAIKPHEWGTRVFPQPVSRALPGRIFALGGDEALLLEAGEEIEEGGRRLLVAEEAEAAALAHVVDALEGAAEVAVGVPPGNEAVDVLLGEVVLGGDLGPVRRCGGHAGFEGSEASGGPSHCTPK